MYIVLSKASKLLYHNQFRIKITKTKKEIFVKKAQLKSTKTLKNGNIFPVLYG